MKTTAPPHTITAIIEQCGRGLGGAFCYVGAHRFAYKCTVHEGEHRGAYFAKETPEGCLDYDVGLAFQVNGPAGQNWTMVVAYEPDDTYSVWLWRTAQERGDKRGEILLQAHDVYGDALQPVIEAMYDQMIKKHCGGFIPCN